MSASDDRTGPWPRPYQPTGAPPTRARHIVTIFAVTLSIITYIDRVCISQAAPAIRQELGLSAIEMGWAFTAFAWAYALFEVPGGWLGDRLGPRRVLMRIVMWWSFFTAATGWIWNLPSLLLTRSLFGVGEAGCFPNLTRVFTTWLPVRERERAQAILWLSSRWGAALTPFLVAYLLQFISWRRAFELFGLVGVVWAVAFYAWYRDEPRLHRGVNRAELAMLPPARDTAVVHGPIPWRLLLTSPTIWLLCAQYVCLAYGWWFYITWLPTYLSEARGTTALQGALLAGMPLLLGGVGCLVSAALTPPLTRLTQSVSTARRILAVVGFTGASITSFLFTSIQDPMAAMLVLSLASFFTDFVMPPAWAACMDIGGRYSGTVSGAMNMMGGIAGGVSPLVVGYLLAWTSHAWIVTFYVSAAIYMAGAVCWLFLDTHTPIEGPIRARYAA
jgi:MFS transporter, ACS family, glucarate transporter